MKMIKNFAKKHGFKVIVTLSAFVFFIGATGASANSWLSTYQPEAPKM